MTPGRVLPRYGSGESESFVANAPAGNAEQLKLPDYRAADCIGRADVALPQSRIPEIMRKSFGGEPLVAVPGKYGVNRQVGRTVVERADCFRFDEVIRAPRHEVGGD